MILKKQNSPERRKFERAKFEETVTVHMVSESKSGNVYEVQGTPVIVRAEDLSEGGIRIGLGKSQAPSKIMKLNFQVQKNKLVDVYTKLAWEGNGSCGLQFVVLDDEIRKWIRSFIGKK